MLIIVYVFLMVGVVAEPDMPSLIWPYYGTALFFVFIQTLFRINKKGSSILIPIIITRTLLMASLIFISHGFFIRELGVVATGPTYTCLFSLISCAFIHFSMITFNIFVKLMPPIPGNIYPIARYIFISGALSSGILATIFLLATGVQSGFALFDGVDRFAYRANQGWLFNVIITFKPVICAMIGFVRFRLGFSAGTRKIATFTFAALLFSSTLFGDKFLSLIVMGAYFFLPYLILDGRLSRRMLATSMAVILIGGAIVGGLTYYVYSDYGKLNSAATSERLFGRFTGQGQLWYIANNQHVVSVDGDFVEQKRLKSVMMAKSGADDLAFNIHAGIFRMVELFAPRIIRHAIFGRDGLVQFTGAGEAYLMLVFGEFGMIMALAGLAVGLGIVMYYVYNSVISGSLFGFIFSVYLMMNYSSMINQASFWQVFGVRALVYTAIMVAIDVCSRIYVNRGKSRKNSAAPRTTPRPMPPGRQT